MWLSMEKVSVQQRNLEENKAHFSEWARHLHVIHVTDDAWPKYKKNLIKSRIMK